MAVNVYEGMYIFEPGRFARDAAGVSGKIEKMVEEAGGEMLVSRLWEERRLAYPIKGNRKGTYWLTYFRADGEQLTGMNRKCVISDDVMRHMFVKIDDRIAETLVAHALGRPAKDETPSDGKAVADAATPDAKAPDAKAPDAKAPDAKATASEDSPAAVVSGEKAAE